jgi:branched-subunit amino acid aminotransferase/4-amino-4-deoxychorismate lyase
VRALVCEEARAMGMDVSMGALSPEQLASADEAFLTNSGIGVAPLVEVDGAPIAGGSPGEATLTLAKRFEEREQRSTEDR